MTDNSMRTPIGRVRGLGSAKSGLHHWWMQRVPAVALIPLTLWFVASLISLAGAGYAETVAWLSSPIVAVLMIAL
ncbi:MAG: succinate dehydrogenase, hydrophobic membrane anchor protein, partial [Nisaea sp.]